MESYLPPFDLTADMLFAAAVCPMAPLQCIFPGVPFLAVRGRTPLVLWFSRVTEACHREAAGERRCEGGAGAVLYYELNVVALLREAAAFVPGIYATDQRTIRIGRTRYGMPKQPTAMEVKVEGRRFEARTRDGARESFVRARLLGSGRPLARLLSYAWPWRAWPIRFPGGTAMRPLVESTPRVYLARLEAGRLALEAAWLPRAVALLPLGLYAPGLRMQLPP